MADSSKEVELGAYQLGAKKNYSSEDYYVMKRIEFYISWRNRSGPAERKIGIYTMKANLDSEKQP